jgi:hypothetical protein
MSTYKGIRQPDGKDDRAKINNQSYLKDMKTHFLLALPHIIDNHEFP